MFFVCTWCGKVYWEGSHYENISAQFSNILHLHDDNDSGTHTVEGPSADIGIRQGPSSFKPGHGSPWCDPYSGSEGSPRSSNQHKRNPGKSRHNHPGFSTEGRGGKTHTRGSKGLRHSGFSQGPSSATPDSGSLRQGRGGTAANTKTGKKQRFETQGDNWGSCVDGPSGGYYVGGCYYPEGSSVDSYAYSGVAGGSQQGSWCMYGNSAGYPAESARYQAYNHNVRVQSAVDHYFPDDLEFDNELIDYDEYEDDYDYMF